MLPNFAPVHISQFTCSTVGFDQIKRTAPLTGPMRSGPIDVVAISAELEKAGVAAIAVNTDRKSFGCTYEDLTNIKVSSLRVVSYIILSGKWIDTSSVQIVEERRYGNAADGWLGHSGK